MSGTSDRPAVVENRRVRGAHVTQTLEKYRHGDLGTGGNRVSTPAVEHVHASES